LCHNVGVFPILAQAEYENYTDTFALQEIVETVQVALGSSLLKRWNFPEEIYEIPRRLASHTRAGESVGLLDVVAAARGLNKYFNHEHNVGKNSRSGSAEPINRVLPQTLSLLIYELTGFDPLSNFQQVELLRKEIEAESSGD